MKTSSFLLGCMLLFAGFAQAADKPVIRIGARVFTEQTLLAEITSQYLRAKGYDTRVTGGLGSNLARSAQMVRRTTRGASSTRALLTSGSGSSPLTRPPLK